MYIYYRCTYITIRPTKEEEALGWARWELPWWRPGGVLDVSWWCPGGVLVELVES